VLPVLPGRRGHVLDTGGLRPVPGPLARPGPTWLATSILRSRRGARSQTGRPHDMAGRQVLLCNTAAGPPSLLRPALDALPTRASPTGRQPADLRARRLGRHNRPGVSGA